MAKPVLLLTLISLWCCVLLVKCVKPTSTCEGHLKQCGDNKCCCTDNKAHCANFGGKLIYIPKFTYAISRIWFTNNSLSYLSAKKLENLTYGGFREIHLVHNDIESIAEDAFKGLKSLGVLEISGNSKLNISSLWNSFKSLESNVRLSLILNSDGIQTLDDDPFRILRTSSFSVNRIDLANNKIEQLNISSFSGLNKLTDLDISMNMISEVSQPVLLRSLTRLNLHGNKISGYPAFLCSKNISKQVDPFPNLEFLELSKNGLNQLDANSWNCLKKLQKLYLNENDITSIPKNVFSRLANLTELDIRKQISLQHISPYGFNSSSLTKIFVNDNHIIFDKILNQNESIYIFQYCPNLEVLDVSENKFTGLNDTQIFNMFANLSKLKSLFALGIKLINIPTSFLSNFPNLTFLDLDRNYIKSLKGVFQEVQHLQKVSIAGNRIHVIENGTFPDNLMKTLKVLNLANNPFDCTCDMLWFRNWIQKYVKNTHNILYNNTTIAYNITVVNHLQMKGNISLQKWPISYVCRSPLNKKDTRFSEYNPTKESCKTHDPMIIVYSVIGSFLAVFSILSMVIYKKQWYIKYMFYKMKIRARRKDLEREPLLDPVELRFDGYVIYDDEDDAFVHNDLIQVVENKLGYKLHIWHRDAESGAKLEVMVDAIYNSENVIAIVSKRFMKNSWCQFAMDVATDRNLDIQREHIFLIILDDVELSSLSKYWCVILTRTPTAYWCEDESDIKRNVFEQKCIKELGTPLLKR